MKAIAVVDVVASTMVNTVATTAGSMSVGRCRSRAPDDGVMIFGGSDHPSGGQA